MLLVQKTNLLRQIARRRENTNLMSCVMVLLKFSVLLHVNSSTATLESLRTTSVQKYTRGTTKVLHTNAQFLTDKPHDL